MRYGHTTDRLSNVFKRRRLLGRGRKGNRGTNRNQGEAGKSHALLLRCIGWSGELFWEVAVGRSKFTRLALTQSRRAKTVPKPTATCHGLVEDRTCYTISRKMFVERHPEDPLARRLSGPKGF